MLKPNVKRLLVEKLDPAKKIGSILLPEQRGQQQTARARVVSVGPYDKTEPHQDINPGDVVVYPAFSAYPADEQNDKLFVINRDDVLVADSQ